MIFKLFVYNYLYVEGEKWNSKHIRSNRKYQKKNNGKSWEKWRNCMYLFNKRSDIDQHITSMME